MARPNRLQKFVQRSDMFEGEFFPDTEFVQETYNVINHTIFDNGLEPCTITMRRTRGFWGMCKGSMSDDEYRTEEIILTNRYPSCSVFLSAIAHEMVHQFQWDVLSNERAALDKTPIMSHGPTFFIWRPVLAKYNIKLTTKL